MSLDSHEVTPEDFEQGKIHNISKRKVLFGLEMTPAILLVNPKYPHNVGAAVRAASCFGAQTVIFTGARLDWLINQSGKVRLPREERMKGYREVVMLNDDYPFNRFAGAVSPVAVEVRDNSERLPDFVHPAHAVYVFGPEDGSIPQITLTHCHRFLRIPSRHCLNLAAAVNVILYDRVAKG
jgi:tRNA(Leu) C34 or U34 (ribose-2'-O)-methylase TrmL